MSIIVALIAMAATFALSTALISAAAQGGAPTPTLIPISAPTLPPTTTPVPITAPLEYGTLADFWNGEAEWQLDIYDVGLPMGESDTVHVEGDTYWSYMHASLESSGVEVVDQCGDPVAFPGCLTRWESHDGGRSFGIGEPVCLLPCDSCPCGEDEEPPIHMQQYPRVFRYNEQWYMAYEWHARVQLLTSPDGLNWSDEHEIFGTRSWSYDAGGFFPNCAGTVEEIGPHPNISWRAADCFNGGPPGIYVENNLLYVFVGMGMNPAHLGCWYNRVDWGAGGMQKCENVLLTGAAEYGPLDAWGEDAAPYWDFRTLSSAEVVRVDDYYYMFYEGIRGPGDPENPIDDQFGLGLARRAVADGIDGPWDAYPGNPILDGLPGTVGIGHADVVFIDARTYLYTATSDATRGRYVLVRKAPATAAAPAATSTPDNRPGPTPDGARRDARVPILMYHYISVPPEDADNYRVDLSVTPDEFRRQMQYIADNGYHTVTLDDVIYALAQGEPLPPKPVVLTFDDGYADMYTNVFPILQEFGFVGTFFVVTARIDEQNPRYLTWEQVRAMAEAGMRIESHSKTHPDLTDKPNDFIVYEVLGSIESIEAHTGRRPRFFCYPGGAYDDYLIELLPEFGVWGAVTTEAGVRHYSDRPYTMRRVRVENDTTLEEFAAFLEWGKEGDR